MVLCKINVWHHLRRYVVASWMIIQEMTYVEPAERRPRSERWRTPLSRAPGRFTSVTAFLVKLDTLCRTMKMTRNADSLACTCLRLPGNALLKIVKPSTKETREVRAVFCVVSVFFYPCTCRPRRHSRIACRGLDCDDVEGYRPS